MSDEISWSVFTLSLIHMIFNKENAEIHNWTGRKSADDKAATTQKELRACACNVEYGKHDHLLADVFCILLIMTNWYFLLDFIMNDQEDQSLCQAFE